MKPSTFSVRRSAFGVLLLACALANSGCVALIAARQRAALPDGRIGQAKVVVNIPLAGGGSLDVKDALKTPDSLKVGEYHSQIQTSYGMIEVHLVDAELAVKK